MSRVEELLEAIVAQNEQVLERLDGLSGGLGSIDNSLDSIDNSLDWTNTSQFAGQIVNELSWINDHSFAAEVLRRLDAIELSLLSIEKD